MNAKLMKEAHKMAKEIKREYPSVDYKFQLGLCIKYLLKESKKEGIKMTELKGTERQIKFANDIRNYVVFQLENTNVDITKKNKFIEALAKQKNAKFIIDNFVDNFKVKDVRATALDYFKYNELSKVTQAELKRFKTTSKTENEQLKDLEFKTEKLPIKEQPVKSETKKEVKPVKVKEKEVKKTYSCHVPKYFSAKYDGYDCETGERINAGDFVWKDCEGIHLADNY